MYGAMFDNAQCEPNSDRRLSEEEPLERLLGEIDDYDVWSPADKKIYHEFVINEIQASLGFLK